MTAEAEAVRDRRRRRDLRGRRRRRRRPRGPRPCSVVVGRRRHGAVGAWRAGSPTASTAPAAPMRWPVTPLVEVTGTAPAPNTLVIAAASAASLSGVEVPWAFTWPTSPGARPGVGERRLHARDRAGPALGGRRDVVGVAGAAVAEQLAPDRWRRGRRRTRRSSSTRKPAPSPMTKPSRAASNGRLASGGIGVRRRARPCARRRRGRRG